MLEGRDDLNFSEKSLAPENRRQLGLEQFDRNQSPVLQILCEEDEGHPATAQLPLDPVSLSERGNDVLEEIHVPAVCMWTECASRLQGGQGRMSEWLAGKRSGKALRLGSFHQTTLAVIEVGKQ